jgi:uncharacterized membrane protein YcaP (DUF421 family)
LTHEELTLLAVIGVKTAIILVVVAGLYRVLGKRYTAQFNVYDLVCVVAVSNALQNAMTEGSGDIYIAVTSALTLIGVGWLLSRFLLRAPKLEGVLIGSPTVIVYKGELLKDRIKCCQVSPGELAASLHAHGLTSANEVEMAILEIDGEITVVPKGHTCRPPEGERV